MRKLLALLICLLLPLTALAELPMYDYAPDSYPQNDRIRQYLAESPFIWAQETVDLGIDKRAPVYSYPSEEGWRAANGKAAVSFKEPFTALAWTENGEWLLIDYEIGEKNALGNRQHRIGYIRWKDLPPGVKPRVGSETLVRAPMTLARDGSLCDDLNGLMKPIARLSAGETVTVLGYVNNGWAYVETEIDGKPARAFLPMAVLEAPAETEDAAMMAELEGLWLFVGGGEILGDGCRFDGQGAVQLYAAGEFANFPATTLVTHEGSMPWAYSVYPNALGTMRYPSAQWVLEIRGENGGLERMGIQVYTDEETGVRCLDVQYGPGGGGYMYIEDASDISFVTWPAPDEE